MRPKAVNTKDLQPVRLLADLRNFNAGEVVGLHPVEVRSLIEQGAAEPHELEPTTASGAPPRPEAPQREETPEVTREAVPEGTKPMGGPEGDGRKRKGFSFGRD